MTIADLDLRSELARARTGSGNFTQKISLAQAMAMRDAGTTAQAIENLISGVIKLLNPIPASHIEPYHPLVGALSILTAHPEANQQMLAGIDESRKTLVDSAIKERGQKWDLATLEWQLVIFMGAVGENAPVDPRRTLAEQEFDDPYVQEAWDVLLQLNMLRTLNKL